MSPQKKLLLRRNAFFRQQLIHNQLRQPENQPTQTAEKATRQQDNLLQK